MRLAHKLLLLVAVLGGISSSLFAVNGEATYEEKLDTTIQNQGFPVALQVGTLTIYTVENGNLPDLYSIRINRSGNFGGGIEYWLLSSREINWQTRFGAQLLLKRALATQP